MPVIPFSTSRGVSRAADIITEQAEEEEAKRYREASDAKLDELMKQKVKRFDHLGGKPMIDVPDPVTGGWKVRDSAVVEADPYRISDADAQASGLDMPMGAGGPENPADPAVMAIINRRKAAQSANLRASLMQSTSTPDQAAADIDTAQRLGVERLEVETNRKAFDVARVSEEIDKLSDRAPFTYSWLNRSFDHLEVAHDDIENLSWWEEAGQFFSPGSLTLDEMGKALATGFADRLPQQLAGLDKMAADTNAAIYRSLPDWFPYKAELVRGQVERSNEAWSSALIANERVKANASQGETWIERGIYSAMESAPSTVAALLAGVVTRNPAVATSGMGGMTAGGAYVDAQEEGLADGSGVRSLEDRLRYALTQGGIETATEMLPMKFLLDDLAKDTPLFKTFFRQAAAEGLSEQAATFLQDASTWLELNPDKTLGEFLAERPNAALETLVASTVMSGVQTSVAKGMQAAGDQIDKNAKQRRAEELAKTFDALGNIGKDSKLLKRLPDKYREFVAEATKDGPLESVRIQPEAFGELAQSKQLTVEQLAKVFRVEVSAIEGAMASGEDVVIPSGNYAAGIQAAQKEIGVSGTVIHSAFAPNMRLRASDFTVREIEAMKEVADKEAKAREEAEAETGFADAADRVREDARKRLAETKRFNAETTSTQATVQAELAVTLAERIGVDPEALWAEIAPQVQSTVQVKDDAVELAQTAIEELASPRGFVTGRDRTGNQRTFSPRDLILAYNDGDTSLDMVAEFDVEGENATRDINKLSSNVRQSVRRAKAEGQLERLAEKWSVTPDELERFAAPRWGGGATEDLMSDVVDIVERANRNGMAPGLEQVVAQLGARGHETKASTLKVRLSNARTGKGDTALSDAMRERVRALKFARGRGAGQGKELAQTKLPMDEASRMARAREMGFDVDNVYYHGTMKDVDQFDPEKFGTNDYGWHGKGVYLATDPEWANTYSGMSKGFFEEGQRWRDKTVEHWNNLGKQPNVMPVYVRGKVAKTTNTSARIEDYPDADALLVDYGNGHTEMVVRDPSNIRGKFAKFDPSESSSSKLLAQETRGGFTGMDLSQEGVIRLYESANLSTFVHETAHWYLTTLERMARGPNPHPFVISQLAAIREWQGKSAEFEIYDANGQITEEGVEVHEAFAETFEAYLREGKAPSTALRSVFATFKAWLLNVYKQIKGRFFERDNRGKYTVPALQRVRLDQNLKLSEEITNVFDRALATDEAILAVRMPIEKNAMEMAQALLDRKIITPKQFERVKERLHDAREQASADFMAKAMDQFERARTASRKAEEREVRRDVASEIDERPEQRAYQWLSGKGWRDTLEDQANKDAEIADGMALLQRRLDLPTPEQREEWVRENTVNDVIPGEATTSRQYGFKMSNGLGVVVSLIPQVNGETEIHWTFLSRLMDRASEEDVYAQGAENLSAKEVLELMPRLLAIVETDMKEGGRDAYTFTSARRSIRNMNARLVRLLEGSDYEIVEFPGQDDPLLIHKDADVADNGKILPRPQNAGRKFEWDKTDDPEAYADAFYARVSDLGPGRPVGRGDSVERSGRDEARRELSLRYIDQNATDESLQALRDRMVADSIVPAIMLFQTEAGRVIAFSGEEVGYSHDSARTLLELGDTRLRHGVYNPRKWPTIADMNASDSYAWYDTTGTASDTWTNDELGQARQPGSLVVMHNLTEQNLFHAEEIGGLAAPSLAVVDTDKGVLNNFGGITLIAEPDFLSTSKVRTFDADIYSPRHPRPVYDIDDKAASAVVKELREETKGLGDLRDIDIDGLHKDGPSSLLRNDMVKAAFFASRGELPKRLPRKEIPQADDATKAAAKLDVMAKEMWDVRDDQRVRELAADHYNYVIEQTRLNDAELADDLRERFFTETDEGQTIVHPNYLQRFILDAKAYRKAAAREVDTIELGSMLSKKLRDKKTEQAFEQYVETLAARMITGKSLFKGFTNAGNRRYGNYTMEAILREMTQDLQSGEGWHYGAGSVRAKYATELKSVAAIRARKGQLVSEEEMKAAKDEGQDALMEILEYLKPYYRFGGGNQFMQMDDMSKALAEGPKGIREAFDFRGDPEPMQRIREFIETLTSLPTEYFEAKAQRAVDLSEFKAAVVPRGTSERALEILRKAGLQIRFYKRDDASDRRRAIRGVSGVLFQTRDKKGRAAPPPNLPPMRLDLATVEDQYGPEALAALPPEVRAYSAQATDAGQYLDIARDVRRTLGKKHPKSLWKFFSTQRRIGTGDGRIAYSGIRDDGGEIKKIIGQKTEAPGLINDREDTKRSRAYDMDSAIIAATEEGYFSSDNIPTIAQFLEILRADIDGTAPLYRRDEVAIVDQIRSAQQWAAWFDQNDIDIYEKDGSVLLARIADRLSGNVQSAISPDEAAPFFKMPDGRALLEALKQGPLRERMIAEETRRRMIERHGDILNDGTLMAEAMAFARNEMQTRQDEIELEALAMATGSQKAPSNLAREMARERLRDKQVREVLNYNQWLMLEQRWMKKAVEAAEKGKLEDAMEFKRFALINRAMFFEGRKLAERIEKDRAHILDYGSRTKQARLFAAGPEYQQHMNDLLADYQFRNETKKREGERVARNIWIRQQLAALDPYAAYRDSTLTEAEQQAKAAEDLEKSAALRALDKGGVGQNYKSLTVAELQAVRDEADIIWKMATTADQLLKQGERRRLTLAAKDVAAEIETSQPNEKPPEPVETDTPGERVKRSALKYFAMHRTLQSWARQFAGGKDGGKFWDYIVRPLNEAFARLSSLRKQMGEDVAGLFAVYSEAEQKRMFRDRQTFDWTATGGRRLTLSKQGRLAFALNWGNDKNRNRLMDSLGLEPQHVQQVLETLTKKDWDFVQKTWDYLDTWFPEANRVHEAIHGAPMDKEAPLEIATRFGIYRGGYYPIKFDPMLSSKAGQRQVMEDVKPATGQLGAYQPGFAKARSKGRITLPLRLSVVDVISSHLDQVARSIATDEALFDAGRIVKQPEVEKAIVSRHGREVYNTIINTLITAKFGLEGASGLLAHLRNGATVVGLGWKVSTALLQPLGISNSIVRVGGYWIAKGYARMGKDAATVQSSANWIMQRSEFMRNRRQANSPEMAALRKQVKAGVVDLRIPGLGLSAKAFDAIKDNAFALMANVQFYSVDMPTWFGAYYKARAAGMNEGDAVASADQAVIDSQGGGELHQTSAMQTGAGTRYAAALRLLTNFMSYMITTYNLAVQRTRNARTPAQIAALALDYVILLSVPVAGKMMIDAWTKGDGEDEDEENPLWERYGREQLAFIFSPFVGVSQIAGTARGEDAFGYRGPAGLGIFAEATNAGRAAFEADFDESFWRPANRAAGMIFHYPAGQIDASIRGAAAYFNGETDNPAAFLVGPPPAN